MQTNIKLQEPITYSVIPIIIFFVLAIFMTMYLIHTLNKKKKTNEKNDLKVIPEKNIKNMPVIKEKYMEQLDLIYNKYQTKVVDLRKAYQLISESIRMFVFESTDISTQNYSLREIKKLNIPELYDLIKEYYEPEFASKAEGDFKESINKARRVVKEWN